MPQTNAGRIEDVGIGSIVDQPPSITSTPAPVFSQGTAATYDMTQHYTDDGISTVTHQITNPLPNGLSFDSGSGILSYDGAAGESVSAHTLIVSDAAGSDESASFSITIQAQAASTADDWSIRTSAAGVLKYDRFDEAPLQVSDPGVGNRQNAWDGAWGPGVAHSSIVWSQAEKASGNGSMRIDLKVGEEGSSINYRYWLKPPASGTLDPDTGRWTSAVPDLNGFDVGDTYYVAFRVFFDTDALYFNTANGAHGFKLALISDYEQSATLFEVACISSDRATCFPTTYGAQGLISHAVASGSPCNPSNERFQNLIDSGLTPINDCHDYAERYGPVRFLNTGNINDENDVVGPGYVNSVPPQEVVHPFARSIINGIEIPNREWLSIQVGVTIRSWTQGDAVNDVKMWLAPDGEDWTPVLERSQALGNAVPLQAGGSSPQQHRVVWFTPFHNGGQTNSRLSGGGDTYCLYDEIITSTEFIQAPGFAVPDWFPDVGEAAVQIDTNDLNDVTGTGALAQYGGPDPTAMYLSQFQDSVYSKFVSWSGGIYAYNQGALGSICLFGGGHGQWAGNDVPELDIFTRLWTRRQAPTYPWPLGDLPATQDYPFDEYDTGQPCTIHSYDQLGYDPEANELVKLWASSPHRRGGGGGPDTHHYSLDPNHSGQRWRRGGARGGLAGGGFEGTSWYDHDRKVFFTYNDVDNNHASERYNPLTESWTLHDNSGQGVLGHPHANSCEWRGQDAGVCLINRPQSGSRRLLHLDVNPTDSGGAIINTVIPESGDIPPVSYEGMGLTHVPAFGGLGKFVAWSEREPSSVYICTPGADWASGGAKTDTWVWTKQAIVLPPTYGTLTGSNAAPFSKFEWLSVISNKGYIIFPGITGGGQSATAHFYLAQIDVT